MTRRQVSIFLNGKEVAGNVKAITAEKRKLNRELNRMDIGSKEYIETMGQVKKLEGVLKTHRNELRGIDSSWTKIKAGALKFAGIAGAAFTADAIINYGTELFRLGTEMDTLSRKAKVVFGEALPLVTKAANENALAMGLTTSQYTDQATAIGDLLIPMGFQRREAAELSTSMLNVSGALSEWTGGQKSAAEVSRILSKALLGEREELKQLGISIKEADVKTRLAEKGFESLTGKMLEQAKAAVTLELITEKSADAQTAFAENSDSLIRKQQELQAKISEVSERLATALLPIFDRLVDIAGLVADGILDISKAFGGLLDPIQSATDSFDQQSEKVNTLESDLVPLLERYEQIKNSKVKEEQEELAKVIQRIGEITPTAITKVDEYGKVLGINADRSREFLEAEKARLAFINEESIATLEKEIAKLKERQQSLKEDVETGRGQSFFSQGQDLPLTTEQINRRREKLIKTTQRLTGAEAELARLRGDNLKEAAASPPESQATDPEPSKETQFKQASNAEALAKQREKQAGQEAKALAKRLQRLQEITQKFQEEARLSELSESEEKIARLEAQFDKEIAAAKALEAKGVQEATQQRLELERIKEQAVLALRQELAQQAVEQSIEAEIQKSEAETLAFLAEQDKRNEIRRQIAEELRTEREQALLDLELHYFELLARAEEYGINTVQLEEKYRKERSALIKKFDQKDQKQLLESQKKQAQLLANNFTAVGNVLGSVLQLVGDQSTQFAGLSKILALAQIGTSSAAAIAKATESAAGLPFPANLAAIATAVATVLGNIAAARAQLSSVKIPQKKEGRWLRATGQDDNINYRVQYIGQPTTGMLPDHPVLLNSTTGTPVIASERGSEYFVSNKALQNPAVFNHVRAIENIMRYRQFQEGGPTGTLDFERTSSNTSSSLSEETLLSLTEAINLLNQNLENGIYALLDDDTIIDLRKRINQLVSAGGGTLT